MATNGKINFGRGPKSSYIGEGGTIIGFEQVAHLNLKNSQTDQEMIYFATDTDEIYITKSNANGSYITKSYGLSKAERLKLEKSFTNIAYNDTTKVLTLTRTNSDVESDEAKELGVHGENRDYIVLPNASSTWVTDKTEGKYNTQEAGEENSYPENERTDDGNNLIDVPGLMTPNQVKELRLLRHDLGIEEDNRIENDSILQEQIDELYGYSDEEGNIIGKAEAEEGDSITIKDINNEIDVVDVELNDLKEDLWSIRLRPLTSDELNSLSDASNVREAFRLVSTEHNSSGNGKVELGSDLSNDSEKIHEDSSIIKIYKDKNLKTAYLGSIYDTVNESTGEVIPNGNFEQASDGDGESNVPDWGGDESEETTTDALCFVYQLADGTYELVAVPVGSFLRESEFKHGLIVGKQWDDDVTGISNTVAVKLADGKQPEEVTWLWKSTDAYTAPDYLKDSKSSKYLVLEKIEGENANVALRSDLIDQAIAAAKTEVKDGERTISDSTDYSGEHIDLDVVQSQDPVDNHTVFTINWTETDIASEHNLKTVVSAVGLSGTEDATGYFYENPDSGLTATIISDGKTSATTHFDANTDSVKKALKDLDVNLILNDERTKALETSLIGTTAANNQNTTNEAQGIMYKIADGDYTVPSGHSLSSNTYSGSNRLCLSGTEQIMGTTSSALEKLDYHVTDNHVHLTWIDRE